VMQTAALDGATFRATLCVYLPPIKPYVSVRISMDCEKRQTTKPHVDMTEPRMTTGLHPKRLTSMLASGPATKTHDKSANIIVIVVVTELKPTVERVQALADISRSALCCHSNETRAPTANPPNNAQSEGTPYHSQSYTRVPCSSVWECGDGQTDRQTAVANVLPRGRTNHVSNVFLL